MRTCLACNRPIKSGSRCPEHQLDRKPRRTLTGWHRIRKLVLLRDGFTCQTCGKPATCVDHIRPLARGGSDHPSNLRASCGPCNQSKGARWTPA
jgi:5-methylcytosine-specific restriction endonuclease McrA